MGIYSLEKPIYIKASGVVLRGEGMSDTGTILFGKVAKENQGPAFRRPALINVGSDIGIKPLEATKQLIIQLLLFVPGGGYQLIVTPEEGTDIAREFNKAGITAFVLKYQLQNDTNHD